VLCPLGALTEPRLVYKLRPAYQTHHALGDVLGARGDGDPFAVLCAVGVARGVVHGAVATPLLDHPELVVDGWLRPEDGEDGFDDRHIHHLPPPGQVTGAQRGHNCERRRERGYAVGEAERRERRRAVGLAGDVGEAAHGLG